MAIKFNGKRHTAHGYADEESAARMYDIYAKRFHKEFACLNFPNE